MTVGVRKLGVRLSGLQTHRCLLRCLGVAPLVCFRVPSAGGSSEDALFHLPRTDLLSSHICFPVGNPGQWVPTHVTLALGRKYAGKIMVLVARKLLWVNSKLLQN